MTLVCIFMIINSCIEKYITCIDTHCVNSQWEWPRICYTNIRGQQSAYNNRFYMMNFFCKDRATKMSLFSLIWCQLLCESGSSVWEVCGSYHNRQTGAEEGPVCQGIWSTENLLYKCSKWQSQKTFHRFHVVVIHGNH